MDGECVCTDSICVRTYVCTYICIVLHVHFLQLHTSPALFLLYCTSSTSAYCLQSFRESITSIAGGLVGSVDHNDIVVGTYNGQILGLTSRTSLQQIASISDETKAKVATLR